MSMLIDESAERTTSPFCCDHRRVSAPRLRKVGGGVTQYRRQCLECGQTVGQSIAKAQAEREAAGKIEAFDEVLLQLGLSLEQAKRAKQRADQRAERQRLYDTYLASDAWRMKRDAVMRRCGGICEGCGEARAVDVHHLTYAHVGAELLFELVGLCRSCHEAAHDDNDGLARWLGDAP